MKIIKGYGSYIKFSLLKFLYPWQLCSYACARACVVIIPCCLQGLRYSIDYVTISCGGSFCKSWYVLLSLRYSCGKKFVVLERGEDYTTTCCFLPSFRP